MTAVGLIVCHAAGDNLHHLLAAQLGRDPSFYMLAAACVMIPTVWLPDVKTLSYLGFAGVAGTLSVAATVGLLSKCPSPSELTDEIGCGTHHEACAPGTELRQCLVWRRCCSHF